MIPDHPVDTDRLLARIARLEAQTDIRGRAVAIYRERAREAEARIKAWAQQYDYDMGLENDRADAAEAERDEWRQTALDERAAALDALEQIKVRDARAADIWDEGAAHTEGRGGYYDPEDNPYRASETA